MIGNITRAALTDYQYNLYDDYLTQLDDIMIKRGQASGLSIEYWHIKVDESKNYDDNKIMNSYSNYVYDLFHFVPTINASPVNYQIGYNPQQQGTSNIGTGNFSLYLIHQPLPGDLFRYYPHGGATDKTEVFRITNVRYTRTSKNKLKLYEVDYETAPITTSTLDHVRLNEIYCWDTENHKFLNEELCTKWNEINVCKNELVSCINKWYDTKNGWYGYCMKDSQEDGTNGANGVNESPGYIEECCAQAEHDIGAPFEHKFNTSQCFERTQTRPLIFLNTIIKKIKLVFPALDLKPIFGIGAAEIAISWMDISPENPVYWDTFICGNSSNEEDLINITDILNTDIMENEDLIKLQEEVKCHQELIRLVLKLIKLIKPIIDLDKFQDNSCTRKCCRNRILSEIRLNTNSPIFWGADGAIDTLSLSQNNRFCTNYQNGACIPLYISTSGVFWPNGSAIEVKHN